MQVTNQQDHQQDAACKISVVVGTSEHLPLADVIAAMVNEAP